MSAIQRVLTLVLLAIATASALKIYGDYEEFADYKQGEGEAKGHDHNGHWTTSESDHSGKGHGENLHQHHYFGNSGGSEEGNSKTGGHVKHQVTKGFQNYHHKDEVGKTTRYIDTFGDSGDHYSSHEADNNWGHHGNGGIEKNHHTSGYLGQEGYAEQKFNQKKENFNEKKENASQKKEAYKGNIADLVYAKKPIFYSKPFQTQGFHQVPYPYYFY